MKQINILSHCRLQTNSNMSGILHPSQLPTSPPKKRASEYEFKSQSKYHTRGGRFQWISQATQRAPEYKFEPPQQDRDSGEPAKFSYLENDGEHFQMYPDTHERSHAFGGGKRFPLYVDDDEHSDISAGYEESSGSEYGIDESADPRAKNRTRMGESPQMFEDQSHIFGTYAGGGGGGGGRDGDAVDTEASTGLRGMYLDTDSNTSATRTVLGYSIPIPEHLRGAEFKHIVDLATSNTLHQMSQTFSTDMHHGNLSDVKSNEFVHSMVKFTFYIHLGMCHYRSTNPDATM